MPTLSPEGEALLLQCQAHACVAVGQPGQARRPIHQVEVGGAGF